MSDQFRADHVGSLLRPPALLEARKRHEAKELNDSGLRSVEDDAIAAAIRLQEESGIGVVTDGEFRRQDFRTGFCRGNQSSMWMGAGDYEPIAEKLFGTLPVDRFLLEYDDERSGGFGPLRFVPAVKTVVLGLVSSKTAVLEDAGELRRRPSASAAIIR